LSAEAWSNRPKIDELSLTDILMRRVPTGGLDLNQEIPFSDVQAFLQGSANKLIASVADLPVLLEGFHQLEQGKNYIFTEPFSLSDPILIPAGWVGRISQSYLTSTFMDYAGTSPMFNTLNMDGEISTTSDNGSGGITIVTVGAHGLKNGQFVNITDTTSYNQDRLVVSNQTGFGFDVQIAFVANESGNFNTGYGSVIFDDFIVTNAATADFMDLTGAPILGSTLSLNSLTEFGFLKPGIVRDAASLIIDKTILGFITDGLTVQDCDIINITSSNFQSLSAIITTSIGIIITGALTRVFGIFGSSFTMTQADQLPVRVDSSITAAEEILFQNSPDNNIADDYFDTSSGGLDQTDPQVTAINNGVRANSMTISESSTSRNLEVDGLTSLLVPIVDVIPVAGDWVEDSTNERFSVDTTTGLVTYNGLSPITVMIKYSLSAAQESGAAQTVAFVLFINAVEQEKSEIIIVTNGAGNFISGVYNGGNYLINPGDTFQLFKLNITNTNNTDVQNPILLINLD